MMHYVCKECMSLLHLVTKNAACMQQLSSVTAHESTYVSMVA